MGAPEFATAAILGFWELGFTFWYPRDPEIPVNNNIQQRMSIRDATGSIPNFLKTSCEGAKRPRGGGCGRGVVWSFFVFQCGIVCSGAYFRGYFHIFLHIISVFNWVLGTYCHILIKKKKKKKLPSFWKFPEIQKFPEMWHLWSMHWGLLS